MEAEIRKIVSSEEEPLIEGFRKAERSWRLSEVVKIPRSGRFVANREPEFLDYGPVLGQLLTERTGGAGGGLK